VATSSSASRRVEGLSLTYFSEVPSFNQKLGGYSAIPWVFRTLLSTMSPREWMLLSYLYLRSGPEGISWSTDRTIGDDIGLGPKKLTPHLKELERRGFIRMRRMGRNRYVKLVDPMWLAERLLQPDSDLAPEVRVRLTDDLHQIHRTRRSRAQVLQSSNEVSNGKA
jgi:DNA-binding MarR family transcriptional regulator